MNAATFEEDLTFMRGHSPLHLLSSPSGGRVAVSPRWQGRVMTSAVAGAAPSLGFVNRAFIASGRTGTAFDNYGGEDRFWLGPEGGQHGLYFAPGAPFDLDAWQVPRGLQEGTWAVEDASDQAIGLRRVMTLASRSGFRFEVAVARTVRVLDGAGVAERFGVSLSSSSRWVAFESVSRITNAGANAWARDAGLLSVWILGQFPATPDSVVVVPFARASGEVVNDRYFGAVPSDRLSVRERDGYLTFRADGQHRSKIGIAPARAKPVLGSHSPSAGSLTLVRYTLPAAGAYVNSMWELQEDPYAGDVVNSYNDGPVGGGRAALGSFYEIETSSPAAPLGPGESLTHAHATLHVSADGDALEHVAQAALGVSLRAVARAG
jgi:hypothetical protein